MGAAAWQRAKVALVQRSILACLDAYVHEHVRVCGWVFQSALQSIQTGDSTMSGSQTRSRQSGRVCMCVCVRVSSCVRAFVCVLTP